MRGSKHEWEREQDQRVRGEEGAGSLLSRKPMQGLIPGPRDHDLSWGQTLNWLSHPGAPEYFYLLRGSMRVIGKKVFINEYNIENIMKTNSNRSNSKIRPRLNLVSRSKATLKKKRSLAGWNILRNGLFISHRDSAGSRHWHGLAPWPTALLYWEHNILFCPNGMCHLQIVLSWCCNLSK